MSLETASVILAAALNFMSVSLQVCESSSVSLSPQPTHLKTGSTCFPGSCQHSLVRAARGFSWFIHASSSPIWWWLGATLLNTWGSVITTVEHWLSSGNKCSVWLLRLVSTGSKNGSWVLRAMVLLGSTAPERSEGWGRWSTFLWASLAKPLYLSTEMHLRTTSSE